VRFISGSSTGRGKRKMRGIPEGVGAVVWLNAGVITTGLVGLAVRDIHLMCRRFRLRV